jgi:hypothetical protein
MRDFLLDIALPIAAEIVSLCFFFAVAAVWIGVVTGAI